MSINAIHHVSKLKIKNVNISINAEQAFDKHLTFIPDKNSQLTRNKRKHLQTDKGHNL